MFTQPLLSALPTTPPPPVANPQVAPYGLYRTGRGSLVIAAGTDGQFASLCRELGAPELAADSRFATNPGRVSHLPELREQLEEHLAAADAVTWQLRLEPAGIPCGMVRSVAEVFADVGARLVRSVDGIPQLMAPIRLNGQYLWPFLPPPGEAEPGAGDRR